MPMIIDIIYRPMIFIRYSMFLYTNKKGNMSFDIDDEYKMLNFLTYLSPIWYEAMVILIAAEFLFIPYDIRLIIMGIVFIINIILSKMLIKRLKNGHYIENAIEDYNCNESISSRYKNVWIWLVVCMAYLIVQTLPVDIYLMLS